MNSKQKTVLWISSAVLFGLLVMIGYNTNGLVDLNYLRNEKEIIFEKNKLLKKENESLYRMVRRLKEDPSYVENIARHEYGMIGEDELLFKFKRQSEEVR